MTPTSFILTASFLLLLFPLRYSREYSVKKEKELKMVNPISVSLHIKSSEAKANFVSEPQVVLTNSEVKNLALPEESFNEEALELESWMKNPKTWSNK